MSKSFIGTAAWSIPREANEHFLRQGSNEESNQGSHLERYSRLLSCVEINSSFYREHKAETYARWRDTVPESFKFSVKLSSEFTHVRRLVNPGAELASSLRAILNLGPKLGVILVQLPGKLEFSSGVARSFFSELREVIAGPIALEPRNCTWTSDDALQTLGDFKISKVLADPEPCPLKLAKRLPLETNLRYFRLHGTPLRYKSIYEGERLARIAAAITKGLDKSFETWCIFDNTTFGFATLNALGLKKLIENESRRINHATSLPHLN